MISNNLKAFLTDWLQWAKAGAVTDDYQQTGLCSNTKLWAERNVNGNFKNVYISMIEEMQELFQRDGMDSFLPFNASNGYSEEMRECQCHINRLRTEWVERMLSQ